MPNRIKEQIKADLDQAKEAGQLRTERIREIVQAAVYQVATELKSGSSEIRLIVKDAVSAAVENLQEKGGEVKEEVKASIEGAIDGMISLRRESIAPTQTEVKQLQAKLDTEEDELHQEIEKLLIDIEEDSKDNSPSVKAKIQAAIDALKHSEEVALMQKRYAQLQAQAAILRANLAARYGGRYEEVLEHLDEAKSWYNQTRTKAESVINPEQRRSLLEERLESARNSLNKKEQQIRQVLSDLLKSAAELMREKEPPAK